MVLQCSHSYSKVDMTSEHSGLILGLLVMYLSVQIGFNSVIS